MKSDHFSPRLSFTPRLDCNPARCGLTGQYHLAVPRGGTDLMGPRQSDELQTPLLAHRVTDLIESHIPTFPESRIDIFSWNLVFGFP
jgi:hypothetical protein